MTAKSSDDFGEDEHDEFEARLAIGEKVIEMAERVKVIHSVTPGAVASWGFEMDGVRYQLTMTVGQPKQAGQ